MGRMVFQRFGLWNFSERPGRELDSAAEAAVVVFFEFGEAGFEVTEG